MFTGITHDCLLSSSPPIVTLFGIMQLEDVLPLFSCVRLQLAPEFYQSRSRRMRHFFLDARVGQQKCLVRTLKTLAKGVLSRIEFNSRLRLYYSTDVLIRSFSKSHLHLSRNPEATASCFNNVGVSWGWAVWLVYSRLSTVLSPIYRFVQSW